MPRKLVTGKGGKGRKGDRERDARMYTNRWDVKKSVVQVVVLAYCVC